MSNEKRKILEMLSKGTITIEEAERLLSAVAASENIQNNNKPLAKAGPKYLKVLVEPQPDDPDGERVNVRVPMNLIRAGLKWVSFIPKEVQGKVEGALKEQGIDMDFHRMKPEDMEELVQNLNDLQIEVDGKEKVRVFCE